jgi:DNA-binding protein H-NS
MSEPVMNPRILELQKQVTDMQAEVERLKREDMAGVIARIKEAIAAYGLTPADLGFGGARAAAKTGGKKRGRKPRAAAAGDMAAVKATRATKGGKRKGPGRGAKKATGVKFRDASGNTWGGVGKRPNWLRAALAAGKTLQEFAV